MSIIFPESITNLPKADIISDGVLGYISQAKTHQIIFMEFTKDVTLPEHTHESQWEIVLHGNAQVSIDGRKHTYKKGDNFFIPAGVKHHAKVNKGYACIVYFNEKKRYKIK
jgi:quercetin dioxygenase-like cupin family protein